MTTNKKILTSVILAGFAAVGTSFVSAWTGCLDGSPSCSTNTTVTVNITPGDVCIGNEWSFDFGNFAVSSANQTVDGAFLEPFWVDDLRGDNDGYYTTVQMSGDLVWSGSSIPAANVSIRADGGITTIGWSANANVVVDSTVAGWYQTLDSAITLIKRDAGANFWLVGRYGTTPELQLLIPAYQSVGNYTGTLVYTLYEN